MFKKEIQEYVEAHTEELYELLKSLAVIPAPLNGEGRRADFCRRWLQAQGAEDVYLDAAGNVIYPYCAGEKNGSKEQAVRPLIVFMAHMDVVFPDSTELPLYEQDGRIYCPGVGDDTANLAVMLMTAKYVTERRPDTGDYGLLFVCGVGEEGLGNLRGVREICATFGTRIEAFYALDLTMEAYTARAVGSLRYRVSAETQGGHSYHCFGNTNAIAALAERIARLYQVEVPAGGGTTYNVGVISGGTSVNTIAQHAEMLYEIRSDDEAAMAQMEQTFREIVTPAAAMEDSTPDCRIYVEKIGERPCEGKVDTEKRQKLFRYAEAAVECVTGTKPRPVPCSTDCNIPLSMGIPAVCVGTYRGAGAHTRKEYIERDSLPEGLAIALLLVMNYCGDIG